MRNLKNELSLQGERYWPDIGVVHIEPDPNAKVLPAGIPKEEEEKIRQSWDTVAVLKVTPDIPFRVGYIAVHSSRLLAHPVETQNGMFGLRIGDGWAKFFIVPEDLNTPIKLELVERTSKDDPKYSEVPLY